MNVVGRIIDKATGIGIPDVSVDVGGWVCVSDWRGYWLKRIPKTTSKLAVLTFRHPDYEFYEVELGYYRKINPQIISLEPKKKRK